VKENKRILVADDDSGVRDSYVDILAPTPTKEIMLKGASLFGKKGGSDEGVFPELYDLTLVDRGEKALEAVKESVKKRRPFAGAFIDMKMPGIDGAETARRMWAIDPRVKIVIVTAYSEFTPDEIIQVTGRDDIFYLRKPFNPEEIRQFARAFTDQWRLERERDSLANKLKKANKELEDINKNLQKKVQEQASLLIQSEKMASIGILAAGVAHEINNPISFVNSNLSTLWTYVLKINKLLQEYAALETCIDGGDIENLPARVAGIRSLKDKQKIKFILDDIGQMIEESLDGTRRVQEIVRDLRTYSRVDQTELKEIDLNSLIDDTLKLMGNQLKYKVEVVKDYGALPKVRCFSQKITQVFVNLLLNAVQAIKQKGSIKISTRYIKDGRRAEDPKVEIRLSDTGCGISKKDISKIFDPFFTTKSVAQGTGLGLSIVYDIIKAHGGKIMVQSEEGVGTTFAIRLPLKAKL
jgi:signal transduction histidine kinase